MQLSNNEEEASLLASTAVENHFFNLSNFLACFYQSLRNRLMIGERDPRRVDSVLEDRNYFRDLGDFVIGFGAIVIGSGGGGNIIHGEGQ